MTFAIAAAGTGGHVYPGLAVGEALVAAGVPRAEILFVGGDRLEATAAPRAGFPFLSVELRGLQRRFTLSNLPIPAVVARASRAIGAELERRLVRVVLGLGGYVTIPAGLAARRRGMRLIVCEQNAHAGLANRLAARWAQRVFTAFPSTRGLQQGEWVGNPIRRSLAEFDRRSLRDAALDRFGLTDGVPVVGVFGGSLGSGAINEAVAELAAAWEGPAFQLLHLAGRGAESVGEVARVSAIPWRVLDFIDDMEAFFAATDLVIARAGGSVAELTATATPAVLVPGGFGSGGHQAANAAVLAGEGAAVTVEESELSSLATVVAALLGDPQRLSRMRRAARRLARPQAAGQVAAAMMELAR